MRRSAIVFDMPMLIDQAGLPEGTPGLARRDGKSDGSLVTLTDTRPGGTTLFELLWVPFADSTAIQSLQPVTEDLHTWVFSPESDVTGPYRIRLTHTFNGIKTEEIRIFGIADESGYVPPAPGERADPNVTRANAMDPAVIARCERNWPLPGFPAGNPFGWSIENFIPAPTGDNDTPPPPPGSTFRYGTEVPDDHTGIEGDVYLRTTTGEFYYRGDGVYELIAQYGLPTEPPLFRSAGDFAQFNHKSVPARADVMLLEDSANSGVKVRSNLGEVFDALAQASNALPEAPNNPITISGATLQLGFHYDLIASPSGTFYTLAVTPADYGKEIGIRVSGTGTLTIQADDEDFRFLQNDGSVSTSLVLSAANIPSVEYRVLKNKVVRPMRGYVIGTSSGGGSSGGGSTGPTGPWAMLIGAQGWFHPQRDAALYGDDSLTWSGDHVMVTVPAIDWATAYGSPSSQGALSAINIWRPETLALWTAMNGPIRFMDWGAINYNPLVNWADRVLPTDNNYEQYGAPDSSSESPTELYVRGMAFEWMIDLCNRTGRDMWVCIPHQFSDDAILSLATLIAQRLAESLKVYVEYSNETWNFGSGTLVVDGSGYTGGSHRAQADHIIMQGVDGGYPGDNAYYKGYSYHCTRSYKCWEIFSLAFEGHTDRVINTMCVNGNIDLLRQGLADTYHSSTYNPNNMVMHLVCTAPYIEGQNSVAWQTSVNESLAAFGNANEVKGLALTHSCDWGTYEGGMQGAGTGCDTWSQDPNVHDAYLYLYNKFGQAGCKVFCHYTLVGKRSPTKAWGLLDNTFEGLEAAHRWRATLDWLEDNT